MCVHFFGYVGGRGVAEELLCYEWVNALLTIRQLPELIKNATLESEEGNYHNSESSVSYMYLSCNTEIDGKLYKVLLDIRRSPRKNKFYMHRIYEINEIEQVSGVEGTNPKLPYLTSRSRQYYR